MSEEGAKMKCQKYDTCKDEFRSIGGCFMPDCFEGVEMNIKWTQLKAVCKSMLFADCLTNHPKYPLAYDEHCDTNNCECEQSNCPVWRQWRNQHDR